eukprot:CAMPEP_0171017670 /NCGR_PEP_ID=MMETSP0736-20130129/27630_1 /TAXON_ID=186038 /ORGANISM="Fragilariopsis kerguelensis, Strain L26-C5" /LENGTH=394 /DNA_ID=CAMNT_0011453669 /DNA_START=9 /DNA_END=1193 /DNA_ORIENTATION=+
MVSSSSSVSSSSLSSSSFNLSTNTAGSSSAAATGASASSCTTSRECHQKIHQSTATTSTATQKQRQKRRRCQHLYAQKLNNSAASCLEVGQYDRAISSFSKALQLSEQQKQEQGNEEGEEEMMTPMCACYHCSLDGCIEYSEQKNPHTMKKDDPFVCVAVAGETNADADADADTDSSYIYRRPIHVTARSIHEGHNMGSSLCLIISFNLALAYHLKAIAASMNMKKSNNKSSRQDQKYMTVALKLYTYVIRWQTRLIRQNYYNESNSMLSTAASFHNIRFKMVLLNNMSQIHRCDNSITCSPTDNKDRKQKHHEKSYTMCLELLMSQIMLIVEYKTRISSSSSSSSIPYIMRADLKRFLQNTSPLLLMNRSSSSSSRKKNSGGGGVQDQCASAA